MQDKYIQSIRYKLQKRVRRLNSTHYLMFPLELKQFFAFFDTQPLLCSIRDELVASVCNESVESLVHKLQEENDEPVMGATEAEQAVFGYRMLRAYEERAYDFQLTDIGGRYGGDTYHEALDKIRQVFLEPFYEYVDEHIDDQQAILYFLRKYKHRCEWFQRERIRTLATNETRRAESSLAYDLYEYLHDQGIDFSIEPKSASGRADLIAEQVGESKVVADAKVFWPERSKGSSYIVSGFNQIYTYLRDYNEPFGYLVIFTICDDDLKFMVPPTTGMFPSLAHNNKTVFFVVVDICDYDGTASKRGQLRAHEITTEDLIRAVEEAHAHQTAGQLSVDGQMTS